jgi:hypothetical protein
MWPNIRIAGNEGIFSMTECKFFTCSDDAVSDSGYCCLEHELYDESLDDHTQIGEVLEMLQQVEEDWDQLNNEERYGAVHESRHLLSEALAK